VKKPIIISICCLLIFISAPLRGAEKYEGPFVSEMKAGKFKNEHFVSVSFGKVSVLKKRKLTHAGTEVILRFRKEGEKRLDSVTLKNGDYFVLQMTEGFFTIEDAFFEKKYYTIGKKFNIGKSNLSYIGDIRITLLKQSLENYSYKFLIDTNFKKLNFSGNRALKGLLNSSCPQSWLEKTGGKILIPLYQPSAKGGFSDSYSALKAAENGDLETLKVFLKREEVLNKIWENGQTLLMTALESGREETAGFLIGKNPDLSIKKKNGWDHLMFALRYKMTGPAKSMIAMGMDVTGQLSGGWNNLFLALRNGCDLELLTLLLDGGCELNRAKDDGWTPLMMALCYRDEEIAEFLFRKGAEINVKDNEQWTPLMYALRYGKHKLAAEIIENDTRINAANKNGWTPLLFALRNGAGQCAEKLIEEGADTSAAERDGNTPLHFALEYKFPEIAEKIIRKGIGLDKATRYGWTPLMVALRYGQHDGAALLLKKGVSVNGFTKDGWSTLHLAIRYSRPDVAMSILKMRKHDLDDVTKEGWTPLLLSLRYNYPKMAELLLNYKADINIGNKYGWTPLMIAIEYDQPQMAEKLIQMGADQNAKNSKGLTALDIAKKKGYFNLFKLLGGKGLMGDPPPGSQKEPGVSMGLKGTFKEIIPSGKNPRVIHCDNCTPQSSLCHALLEYDSPKLEVFRYLIRELRSMGFKYDKEIKARSESGSLKNPNIWGLVNFTRNTPAMVNAFTIIILSDHKTGTTQTRVDFNLSRMPKKMNINLPAHKKQAKRLRWRSVHFGIK